MIPLDQEALEIATLLSYLCEFIGIKIEMGQEKCSLYDKNGRAGQCTLEAGRLH